jgi:hypothetical protein
VRAAENGKIAMSLQISRIIHGVIERRLDFIQNNSRNA